MRSASSNRVHNAQPIRRAGAFTLLELIVVMILVTVLAGLTVPRMIGTRTREQEAEARSVQRLLTLAAEKASLWSQPVAIDYASEKRRMSLWTLRPVKGSVDTTAWSADPLTDPVELVRLDVITALVDGAAVSRGNWRIVFTPGQPRPAVTVELAAIDAKTSTPAWRVWVGPTATSAVAVEAGSTSASVADRSVDLDASGKGTASW